MYTYDKYLGEIATLGFIQATKNAFQSTFPRLETLEGTPYDPELEPRVAVLEADEPVEDQALADAANEIVVLQDRVAQLEATLADLPYVALTPATDEDVDVIVGVAGAEVVHGDAKTVIDNHTTRINEIEDRLKAYGLLP